jgi:carboxypeptidase PM20D1
MAPGRRRALGVVAAFLALLLVVLAVRTASFRSRQIVAPPVLVSVDAAWLAHRLAGALRFRTVSHQERSQMDLGEFERFKAYLEESFPKVYTALTAQHIGPASVVFSLVGSDLSLEPILLLAHMDVVPVEAGTEAAWEHPPFGGEVAGGFVWGRGALDDKGSLMATLEVLERFVERGMRPKRSIVFAVGHDEEVSGRDGAMSIAKVFRASNLRFAWALDEGLIVGDRLVPGIDGPVALVGIAEKGYLSIRLDVEAQGGHSSLPPRQTAIGTLAAALDRLETHPMPARLEGPARETLDFLGPEMPWARRLVVANLWLFGGLVKENIRRSPAGNATLRTTTAPTIVQAGMKENVLPSRARAVVNFRILPGDSIAGVTEHVRRVIGDPRVEITTLDESAGEPSAVSSTASPGFGVIGKSAREVFPEALLAPGLMMGATDSRHYADLCGDVYRFAPIHLDAADLVRFHGVNERISVAAYADAVRFYERLLLNAAY